MRKATLKQNVGRFNDDVRAKGGYKYTAGASYSSVVANRRMTEAVAARIPAAVRTLIDFGCGDGTYTEELARNYPGAEIVGVDPAQEAVSRARVLTSSATFIVADLLDPGTLPQSVFDVGVIRGVIHHLPDGPAGIANAARLCRTLIIVEPNGNNPVLKLIEKYSRYQIEHDEQSFTEGELVAWCRAAGCENVRVDYIGFVPFFFPALPARLLHSLQPLLESVYPLKKYLSGQIVLTCATPAR